MTRSCFRRGGRRRHHRGFRRRWGGRRRLATFVGYGPGATFTNADATHWPVNYNRGASHAVITFSNGASIDASDFSFM